MTPTSPPARLAPSIDLIRRSLGAELAYTLSRMQILERIPGNPIGITYRRIDEGAVALMARHLPSPSFNTVVGLRAGQAHHVAPLVAWYRENKVRGRFAIVPGDCDIALLRELTRQGYYQSGFHTSLIAEPGTNGAFGDGISVERVESAATMENFLDAYVAGWGIPTKDHAQFKANVRPWLGQPDWTLYLGRIDGKAAAVGVLYVNAKVAYLADATTDPQFRRRGLHAALLRRRLHDAHSAGVDFACSGAEFLSASHRNMERVGLRVQFTRAIWTSFT
jgi:GNAT superfamily N-acetyltransferase